MQGTIPILMCDDEYGCDDYMVDYYEQGATNWRELVEPGWKFDPNKDPDAALCPMHAEPEPSSGPTSDDRTVAQ